ncbi:MAG TPA: hypothetical protein VLA41_03510 [Burkholderiales bacterium]|nr:hypothetical protein [Burkholderiales bacterium]
MYRSLFFVMALLLVVDPVSADSGKKLTNAELKQLTSNMLFSAGYSTGFNVSYLVTWYRNGTREVYWSNGVSGHVVKGKWWLKGDTVCVKNEDWALERCDEWRKNGDRIETWGLVAKSGYFYILP